MRLLSPPLTSTGATPLLPFKKSKSRAQQILELQKSLVEEEEAAARDTSQASPNKLQAQLEGPCTNLRLIKIEARIESPALAAGNINGGGDAADPSFASQWAAKLMRLAYPHSSPHRRLKVLVNPVGGPGKALPLFTNRIRPVLEAAGCKLDVTITTHINHGLELARDLALDQYDAVVCVSGDGMLHEVLNGFAVRKDAQTALAVPVAPIPAGSGNAVALNLLGVAQGFNLALASLNAIKGTPLPIDVCSVTQPAIAKPKRNTTAASRSKRRSIKGVPSSSSTSTTASSPSSAVATLEPADADPQELATAPAKPYSLHYSFLSQAIGLMADVDLGTEDMRALGDARFVIGYIGGVLANKVCEVDLDVKLGERGTMNKAEMRKKVLQTNQRADDVDGKVTAPDVSQGPDDGDHASLRHGAVTDLLPFEGEEPPALEIIDPSWPSRQASDTKPSENAPQAAHPGPGWYRIKSTISALYAGKIPYVSRDLLQFPFALPGDGCVDIALMLHDGGRSGKLRAINGAERGVIVYDRALAYFKVEAYRVTPRLQPGDKRLKKGGLVSIDGEHRPYLPFQVEVAPKLKFNVLSLYSKWVVPDVAPPEDKEA